MTKLDKWLLAGKNLGWKYVDVYAPKGKLTAVTFSDSKKYINKINDII